jgi:serine/threonine protein phosphatase PrpC
MSSALNESEQLQPRWYSQAQSVVGHVRKINEDAFLDAPELGLWVVADGMGGHSRGDRASQTIIARLSSFSPSDSLRTDVENIAERLDDANDFCRQQVRGQVMGSTVALLYIRDEQAYAIWAGDSRIYRLRNNELTQLTEDHSLVQELARLGDLTEEEAEDHPSSNVITRAVGVADLLDLQTRKVELQAGDRFLLCSDGAFKDVKKHEVAANLSLPSMEQALDKIVQLALRRGGTDNITAIVVQLSTV